MFANFVLESLLIARLFYNLNLNRKKVFVIGY